MTPQDKMEVNAAIEKLLALPHGSLDWIDPARIVVRFGSQIPEISPVSADYRSVSSGGSVSGYTEEAGNVGANDTSPQISEGEFGSPVWRVGGYKLQRFGREITISHFWKSSPLTQSETETVPVFKLLYTEDLNPIQMGVVSQELRHLFWIFGWTEQWFTVIQGEQLGVRRCEGKGLLISNQF